MAELPNIMITPGSETAVRMGLKKSAFSASIYRDLPIDYYLPLINSTFESFMIMVRRQRVPKFYQTHDASLMYYQPYDVVLNSLRKQPQSIWQKIIAQTIHSPNFLRLNMLTAGSQELAALAAAHFLRTILVEFVWDVAEKLRSNEEMLEKFLKLRRTAKSDSELLSMTERDYQQMGIDVNAVLEAAKATVERALGFALESVKQYKEAKETAEAVIEALAGAGGFGYTHEALSMLKFLGRPDEVRRRVKLLKDALASLQRFMQILPASLSQQQIVSMVGGISGVDRMLRESQLKDILPQELAALSVLDPKLQQLLKLDLLLRLAQKQVMVYQRAATLKPVIFIDKSGSMADTFYSSDIPKISAAAGLALAMYLKYGADVYFFDTEVEGPISRSEIVDVLLRIQADGGTRIEEVLNKIAEIGKKDYIYIVITDGIDYVKDEYIAKVAELRQNIRFIIVPPGWEEEWLRRNFKYYRALYTDMFEAAVLKALSS